MSNKFISYVAFYVGPIQTGFLRGFQKSYGGTGIVIPVKKVHRNGKHRNPEDSCRNYQPSVPTPNFLRKADRISIGGSFDFVRNAHTLWDALLTMTR